MTTKFRYFHFPQNREYDNARNEFSFAEIAQDSAMRTASSRFGQVFARTQSTPSLSVHTPLRRHIPASYPLADTGSPGMARPSARLSVISETPMFFLNALTDM